MPISLHAFNNSLHKSNYLDVENLFLIKKKSFESNTLNNFL